MIGLKERALIDSFDDLSVWMVKKPKMPQILTQWLDRLLSCHWTWSWSCNAILKICMTGRIWNSCVWQQQRIVWSMKTLFMQLIVENGSGVIQKQPLPLITSFLVAFLFFQRRFTLFTSYYPLVVLWWKSRWNCKNPVTPPNRQVLLIFLCIQEKPWFFILDLFC